jgi:hypothetical protein
MDNLLRVLERTQDPDGQFFAPTSASIAELEIELAILEAHLQRHLAAAPPERDDNTDLLTQLPHAEVDLNALAGDRLRSSWTRSAWRSTTTSGPAAPTFRAEISGEMVDQLTQQIHQAEVESLARARAQRQSEVTLEGDAGSVLIKGSSVALCPGGSSTARERPVELAKRSVLIVEESVILA